MFNSYLNPYSFVDETKTVEINFGSADFLLLTMIPVLIFSIIIIIDWLFFRKRKRDFKISFYFNLIILLVIFLVSAIINLIYVEDIAKAIGQSDGIISSSIYSIENSFSEIIGGTLLASYLVLLIMRFIKIFIFKKYNVKSNKLYKFLSWLPEIIIIACILLELLISFFAESEMFNMLPYIYEGLIGLINSLRNIIY